MRNAKAAIDELPDRAEAPPQPAATAEQPEATEQATSTSYGFGNTGGAMTSGAASVGSFLPHSLGADRVSNNVKSLFPSSSSASGATAGAGHDEYRGSPPDLLSRTTSSQPQELCLTLQSNQHQIFSHVSPNHHGMISSAGVPGWPDHGQRMPAWHAPENSTGDGRGSGNGDSYMFAMPPRQGLDQSQLFSHGEPLQSSGAGWASARTWLDSLAVAAIHHQPSTMAAGQVGFGHLVGSGGSGGGFMGFLAPAAPRLQSEEEHGSEVMRRD
ncbi:hypothetical protein E2562_004093 [Oryza meyeriana var. granulata]|uniref:Uncharacterized protein n=1 Tax=Oryza meyeriana var. granulata TaxID=110450 RepID=A0A6G1BHT3_9ORYZ|nr:hypothetical protein E2562_004093 [Oryza meyeriana var. granulata]